MIREPIVDSNGDAVANQAFTADWVDYGVEVECSGEPAILLWPEVDMNDSLNCRFRAKIKSLKDGTIEHDVPIRTVEAGVSKLQPHYYEYDVDGADQNIPCHFVLNKLVASVQFQIMAGTVGASAGKVVASWVTMEG
jgi:hypothetical protein